MPAERDEKNTRSAGKTSKEEQKTQRNKRKIWSKRMLGSDGGQRNEGGRGGTEEEDLGINARRRRSVGEGGWGGLIGERHRTHVFVGQHRQLAGGRRQRILEVN